MWLRLELRGKTGMKELSRNWKENNLHWTTSFAEALTLPRRFFSCATVNTLVVRSNVLYNQRTTGLYHVTPYRKRWIQLRPRDLWKWVTVHCAFEDGCLTFIGCLFSRTLQQRWSWDGLACFTFSAFLTQRACRSSGTWVTSYPQIPFYTHRSLKSYWSVLTRRSLWPWSSCGTRSPWETWFPATSGFSPSPRVTPWSRAAESSIFSTDLILQQAKLFCDQQF